MESKKEKQNNKNNLTRKLRNNPWILSTIILGIMVLVLVIGNISGAGKKTISSADAGNTLVELAKDQIGDIEILDVKEESGLYNIFYSSNQGDGSIYMTLDGKNLASLMPINTQSSSETQDIPKSDKPKVELFIWSYCPYGVQALSPFAEVAKLLGNKADFSVVLYYDGHGEHETEQNKIQACIQQIDKEKYWDYASRYVEEIYPTCGPSGDVECDKTESIKLMNSVGIDSNAVMSCVESQGETLISEHSARAQEAGVTGSPTIIINDVKANPSSRTAEAFKDSICSAFNTAPSACETELDSTSAAASGNC